MPLDVDPAIDGDEDSVGFGGEDAPEVFAAASDPRQDRVILYSHGRSVRLRVRGGEERLLRGLAEADIPRDFEGWRVLRDVSEGWRIQMSGAVWLGGRKPGYGKAKKCRNSQLAALNRRLHTDLYGIGAELSGGDAYLDLAFVTAADASRFLDRLGLEPQEYDDEYHIAAERFFVLDPHEAHRLADELGGHEHTGRGREAAKHYLGRVEVPITIRTRSKAKLTITIYRIGPGSTSPFKVEAALHGKSNRRQQFRRADIRRLDEALLDLVAKYDLHPIAKPTKWQPRLPTWASLAPRDVSLRRLRPSAWRGARVPQADRTAVSRCNTPLDPILHVSARTDEGTEPPARISTYTAPCCTPSPTATPSSSGSAELLPVPQASSSTSPCEHPEVPWVECEVHPDFTVYSRSHSTSHGVVVDRTPVVTGGCPFHGVVDEIDRSPGLTEVVFDHRADPGVFLDCLVDRFGPRLGVGTLALDATYLAPHARRVVAEHPLADGHGVVVLVVDVSATALISSAFTAGTDAELLRSPGAPGPFSRPRGGYDDPDGTANWWRGLAALLADYTEAARRLVEREGSRVILVTQDARPLRGRGAMNKQQESRDTRVRSIIGNAGRRSCHQRFFVEPRSDGDVRKIVLWKDEIEGLVGRTIFMNTRAEPSWGRRRPGNQVLARTWTEEELEEGNGPSLD